MLGIGDSVLLHLWEAYHCPSAPFRTLRIQPYSNAPAWRARVLALPFVRNWQGERYTETMVDVRVSLLVTATNAHTTTSDGDEGSCDPADDIEVEVRACVMYSSRRERRD